MKIRTAVTELRCIQVVLTIFKGSEIKKEGTIIFMCGTHCLDLIYISIKYREDILKIVYGWMDGRTERRTNIAMP